MTRSIKTFITLLGVIFSFTLQAQTQPDTADKPGRPGSFLRILYTPLNLGVAEGADLNFNIEWEKPLTSRLSFDLVLYHDLDQVNKVNPDLFDGLRDPITLDLSSGTGLNVLASLSLGVNYYLKPDQYDGWYASVRMNNFLSVGHRSYPSSNGLLIYASNFLDSRPTLGFYLGYRKVFKNGLFIDGRVGVTPLRGFKHMSTVAPRNMDLRIGIGYQFKLRKKKK